MSERKIAVAATRLPESVLENLRAAARREDRSVSSELRRLIISTYSAKS